MTARALSLPGAAPTPDDALFARIADGDLGPLGELFDRHHADVRRLLVRILVDATEADDLVQETFLTAARAAASFEPGGSARKFLLGVAGQLVRRRRRGFARLRAMLSALSRAPVAPPKSAEELLCASEDDAAVKAAIARLSEDQRIVIVMVELGGMSGVEVARSLGVPAGTVWRRLHEARGALRRALEKSR